MSNLSTKIELYLGREVDFLKDVVLHDRGDGVVYIEQWNVEEAQPTEEQLNALEAEATTIKSNNQVINTRINLYGTPEQQIENIMENGLDAEISRVNQIKSENPKT
jgi:hypothetical protein